MSPDLSTPEMRAAYLNDALQNGGSGALRDALREIVRVTGGATYVEDVPRLLTVRAVLDAAGLTFSFHAKSKA